MTLHGLNSPISRGFRCADGVARLTLDELIALQLIMRLAAQGCVHENHSRAASQLFEDAEWLARQIGDRAQRAERMRGGR